MTQNIHLLIIDPQNDFCDLPAEYCPSLAGIRYNPSLPVTGAHADMLRLSHLIQQLGSQLSHISLTLDSHQHIDIAHPSYWKQANGEAVAPFTCITAAAVRAGQFLPYAESLLHATLAYLDTLEAHGSYTHMVWPIHCELGSWGHNIHPAILAACNDWEEKTLRSMARILKGMNPSTEHFSAIRAEVPDPDDLMTQNNIALLESLRQADHLLIAGEASSHCVRASTQHIADYFPAADQQKITLLTDCMSPVTGFETQHHDFLSAMQERGIKLADSHHVIAQYIANP